MQDRPVALIAGSGIGIGAANARRFADNGYHVIVSDVLDEQDARVVADIQSSSGSAAYYHLDVSRSDQTNAIVDAIQAEHGRLDAVVANAGIAHRVPLNEMTDQMGPYPVSHRPGHRCRRRAARRSLLA